MKRVILDCDGVIVDFVKGYLGLLNSYGRTNFRPEEIDDWDIVKSLKVPKPVVDAAHTNITYHFCRTLDPIKGAIEGVKKVLGNAEVLFVTSPWLGCYGWMDARTEWLAEHLGVKGTRIMHGSQKDWVDADFIVDDKASTVLEWAKTHPRSTAVMWDQPWNRPVPDGDYVRTNSWDFLAELVR